jgi:hypothetical protein
MREGYSRHSGNGKGIVLLVTLVLLVVLATLGYTLTSHISAQRHRQHYLIDYQIARYSCDSAVKYALAAFEDINNFELVARPNEPDFSDLFTMTDEEYEQLLADWSGGGSFGGGENPNDISDTNEKSQSGDITSFEELLAAEGFGGSDEIDEPAVLTVRGPYGPNWPYVTEPLKFEIGSASVTVEIEDENAKYPIGWAILKDEEVVREAEAGLETFCEWMDVNSLQIDSLKDDLKGVSEIKEFKLDFKPVKETEKTPTGTTARSRRSRRTRTARTKTARRTIPASMHISDFANLFHSSLIDTEALARPKALSERRKESVLKYIGLWGSNRVNINTAPRHVLEAAFTFGGDADKIAQEIITRRRIQPFENIEDLRQSLLRYSTSIEKCEKYITTTSNFFTIRVTAVSGVAKASAVLAVTKEGGKTEKIAVISG